MAQCTQFTHGRPTTPDPTSPTLQVCKEESGEEKEEEKELLLDERKESVILNTPSIQQKDSFLSLRSPLQWNWRNILTYLTLWFAYLSVNASYSVITPFFPKEAAMKGANSVITGVIVGSSSLCVVIFSPVFGYFLPRLGVRFVLLSGLLLVGGAYVLLGFTAMMPSGWVFIMMCMLLRLAEGVGSAMFITAAMSIPPQLFPESVGTVTGLMEVAAGIGFTCGPPIGGVLYAAGGFGVPFWVVGGLTLSFVPLGFLIVKVSVDCQQLTVDISTLRKLSINLPFFALLLGVLLNNAGFGFTFPVFQLFLNLEFGLKEEQVGLVLLAGPLTYLTFALISGKLTDKLGPRYLGILGTFLSGIAFFLLGPAKFISTPKLWLVIFGYAIVGIGAALAIVPVYADLLNIAESRIPDSDASTQNSLVSGLSVSFLNAGFFIGPLAGGTLYQVIGFQTSSTIFGELLTAQGFLLLGITLIDKLHRRYNHVYSRLSYNGHPQ